jgi:hypothetical protein
MIGSNKFTANRNKLVRVNALAIVSAHGLTTLHHIYGGLMDNAPNRLTVPMIMAVPTVAALVALHRYERTGSKTALATATTVTSIAWVGLSGLFHGGYAHAYKDVSLPHRRPSQALLPAEPLRALPAGRSPIRDHRSTGGRGCLPDCVVNIPAHRQPWAQRQRRRVFRLCPHRPNGATLNKHLPPRRHGRVQLR